MEILQKIQVIIGQMRGVGTCCGKQSYYPPKMISPSILPVLMNGKADQQGNRIDGELYVSVPF